MGPCDIGGDGLSLAALVQALWHLFAPIVLGRARSLRARRASR